MLLIIGMQRKEHWNYSGGGQACDCPQLCEGTLSGSLCAAPVPLESARP